MLALTLLNWLFRGKPTLPVNNATQSYWQSEPADIADLRSTEELTEEVFDYAVIGSGLTGSAICLELLQGEEKPSVVLLEARNLCSGATGRNGGHMLQASYLELSKMIKLHGFEAAWAQYQFTRQNYDLLTKYIAANDLAEEVGFRQERRWEVFFDTARWHEALKARNEMQARGVDLSDTIMYTGEEADRQARTTGALGAYSLAAGVFWPYKFVCHLLKRSIGLGLQVHANTPVTQVVRDEKKDISVLCTPRGPVLARKVIYAANAYTGALLPELHSGFLPCRGHVVAIEPEGKLKEDNLEGPYIICEGEGLHDAHEYMHQRKTKDGRPGPIIIGGAMFNGDHVDLAEMDDSTSDKKLFTHMKQEIPRLFAEEWSDSQMASTTHEWTGVMAITWGEIPMVGALNRPGQYCAAAFSGVGMSWCFLTAKTLVAMIRDEPTDIRTDLVFTDPRTVSLYDSLKRLIFGSYR